MSKYHSMMNEMDRIIEEVSSLSLEEGELFRNAFQKRQEYIDLLIQAKRTKASFQNTLNETLLQNEGPIQTDNVGNVVYGTTTVTDNDLRFGILRFSKISEVAKSLQPNSKILIKYKGDNYQGSIPKSVPGRVNGLANLYSEHQEFLVQRKITLQYDLTTKIMIIQ